MSTKDQTHEAIAQALTSGAVLTHEQRGVLLGLVADDQQWQRECDRMQAELAAERERWAAEIERLCDELQLCCELKRSYQAQVAAEVDRTAEVRQVAVQVLRDMQAQGVLIEWQTVLAEALGERTE